LVGNTLYGTASSGGSNGNGATFAISINGTNYTNLNNFSVLSASTNSDGANPDASLAASGNLLYGTTYNGGLGGSGTIFSLGTNGMDFTNLYSFSPAINLTNRDGQNPQADLVIAGSTLYGTTGGGGSGGNGTVFRINIDGTGFTNLHSFTPLIRPLFTNVDGANPSAGLLLAGGVLYGTTTAGGLGGNGTVFAIATNGTSFTNLYNFSPLTSASTNVDGANPQAALVCSGTNLFGTAVNGGASGNGTVFRLGTNGAGFATLHSFSQFNSGNATTDGANPSASLLLVNSALYGTALRGGTGASGAIFKLNLDGSGFTSLYNFSSIPSGVSTNSDGANPSSSLVFSNNTFYGTAGNGGAYGEGTVFSLRVLDPIPLSFQFLNRALVLTWTNPVFALQSATSLLGTYTNVPGAVSPYTNVIGAQRFFRLKGN